MSVLLYFRSSIDMLNHVWIFSVLSLVFLQPESSYLEKFHLLHRFSYTHSGIVSTYTSPASLVWELWRGSKDPQHNKAVDTWCFLDQDTKLLVNVQQLFSLCFYPRDLLRSFFPFLFNVMEQWGIVYGYNRSKVIRSRFLGVEITNATRIVSEQAGRCSKRCCNNRFVVSWENERYQRFIFATSDFKTSSINQRTFYCDPGQLEWGWKSEGSFNMS